MSYAAKRHNPNKKHRKGKLIIYHIIGFPICYKEDVMKKIWPIIIFCLLNSLLYGQDQKQYNHFIANQGLLNPAYNGTRDVISGLLVVRNQWVGIEGAPVTQALNVHAPINYTNLGVGLSIANENMGAHHSLDLFGATAYRIEFAKNQTLSLGVQLGFNSFTLDESKIVTTDNTDGALYGSSNISFNAGFGAYYYSDKLFLGFSIPQFFTNIYDTNAGEYNTSLNMRNVHYYLYGGYVFEINENLAIKPSLLNRIVYGAPWQSDITCSALFYQKVWGGLTFKSSGEIVLLTEYIINDKFTVRYSYDYPFSDLNSVANGGSHEIGLQFDFMPDRPVMRSIRYF